MNKRYCVTRVVVGGVLCEAYLVKVRKFVCGRTDGYSDWYWVPKISPVKNKVKYEVNENDETKD